MHGFHRPSIVLDRTRRSIPAWQDRIRDPSLTALLVLELCAVFFAAPLAAKGLPIARAVADTLVFAVLVIVVVLSRRWGAIVLIFLGLMLIGAGLLDPPRSLVPATALRRAGDIITFSALTWVVAHAVYGPGRITFHRLQGAVVLYLNFATIFAAAYGLIWELNPDAFTNLLAPMGETKEVGTMLYFSLTTLTTTGYGDIVAVDPFARSLTNLESVVGQFFLAITVARLVTLELRDRRR
jgi:Ion channel